MRRRRLWALSALTACILSACSFVDDASSAFRGRAADPSTASTSDAASGTGDAELPPLSGTPQELLVEPHSVPGLVFIVPEGDEEQTVPEPPDDVRYEPTECAPKHSNDEFARYTWDDGTLEYSYSVTMLGRGRGLDNLAERVRSCPSYSEIGPDSITVTTNTLIDAPPLEGAVSQGVDMQSVTTYADGRPSKVLRTSSYLAEVREVTFFVVVVSHEGKEIGGEQRHLMNQLFEAQVSQLRHRS